MWNSPDYNTTALSYMYGISMEEARTGTYTDEEKANAHDYFETRGLPTSMRQDEYRKRVERRHEVAEVFGLSQMDAIGKRDGLDLGSFADAVDSLSEIDGMERK